MKISVIGDRNRLEPDLQDKIAHLEKISADKPGMKLTLAINYGGRDEILRAAKKAARLALGNKISPDDINEEMFASLLDTDMLPYPDLLIRTGGEKRISNFLLWQLAYSEIYLSDKLWPDFNENDLKAAVEWFNSRERRFGGSSG
jgi:undecaprenyl diphosphate synthase